MSRSPAALRGTGEMDKMTETMEALGVEVTRENYIEMNWVFRYRTRGPPNWKPNCPGRVAGLDVVQSGQGNGQYSAALVAREFRRGRPPARRDQRPRRGYPAGEGRGIRMPCCAPRAAKRMPAPPRSPITSRQPRAASRRRWPSSRPWSDQATLFKFAIPRKCVTLLRRGVELRGQGEANATP